MLAFYKRRVNYIDRLKKMLVVCGATVLLTSVITYGLVRTVEKGLYALGGSGGENYVSCSDKFIGVFITTGSVEKNKTQDMINKEGKVYGQIQTENMDTGETRFVFSTLEGEVFSIQENSSLLQPGKYGAFHYSGMYTDKETAYDEQTGQTSQLLHNISNIEMNVNMNAVGEKLVMYVNPIFENANGDIYVTDNKCEKVEHNRSNNLNETCPIMLETKTYNKSVKEYNNRININLNYKIPEMETDNSSLFF